MDNLRQTRQLSFAFEDPREVPCFRCGKLLPKKNRKRQYCDWACLTDLPKKECEWCGVSFRARPCGTNQFCARPCHNAQRAYNLANPPHCRLPGCKKKARYKREQLCDVHYWRRYRHGYFEPPPGTDEPLPISVTEAAWLAGILDGEGHIGLAAAKQGERGYMYHVSVVNTDQRMIDKIVALTQMGAVQHRPAKGKARQRWTWEAHTVRQLRNLLITVRPYLVIKGEQADLLLRLPILYERCPDLRREIYLALRKLNKKGNPDYTPPDDQ